MMVEPEIEIPKRIRIINGFVNPDDEDIWIPIHKIEWLKADEGGTLFAAGDGPRFYIDAPIEDVLRELGRWLH